MTAETLIVGNSKTRPAGLGTILALPGLLISEHASGTGRHANRIVEETAICA